MKRRIGVNSRADTAAAAICSPRVLDIASSVRYFVTTVQMSNRLTRWIMLSMLLGVVVGCMCNAMAGSERARIIADHFSMITDIFLRMIKMIIGPLVFSTLVSGIASMQDTKAIGRIVLKVLAWFFVASLVSLSIGLLFVNCIHPGTNVNLQVAAGAAEVNSNALNWKAFVTHIVPTSIFDAMAGNEIMQILVFSLFFGIALARVTSEAGRSIKRAIDGLMEVMLRITNTVMCFAPLATFAALAVAITVRGVGVVITYGRFIGGFYLALLSLWALLFVAGYMVLGRHIYGLLRCIREPMLLAFSTASSEAAYPKLIERLQHVGIPRRIVGFVLPLGYSFNLDGSMVYQAFAAVFIAQGFHVPMTLGQQITMLLVLMASSKGMAGVPRGALLVVAAISPMFGLPEAGVLFLLGIDQFLDMGRAATNVLGNSIATAVVARWENEFRPDASD
jgi:Na+/H+-dicarboxylate symporter